MIRMVDLVVHGRGTVYPHKYLLGVVLTEEDKQVNVMWFYSGRTQTCNRDILVRLQDYEGR